MLQSAEKLACELDTIVASSYDGIFVTDGNGVTLRVNEAYERLSGFKAEDLVNRSVDELLQQGILSESVVPQVLRLKQRATVINANRHGNRLLVTGTPVLDAAGRVWRVVCNVRDITELVQLQADLERSNQRARHYESLLHQYRDQTGDPAAGVVAVSRPMRDAVDLVRRAAATDSTVLLLGESGVGKEVLVELVHKHSPRQAGPFVKVNCAAVPDSLMEAEFFGYERGAFTGARQTGKPGFFELASGGTLFLDEIGDLPMHLQSKLLRVLQDFQVMRLGGSVPHPLDVRLVAATNVDLAALAASGRFRQDLYYRLNVIPVQVPPLRERPEDIPLLAVHFVELFNQRYQRQKSLSRAALECLEAYQWPGNVRELRNLIERLVTLTESREITPADLPAEVRPVRSNAGAGNGTVRPLREVQAVAELQAIERAVRQYGSIRQAARALGVNHATLVRKLQRMRMA